jgi:hypothetical protein
MRFQIAIAMSAPASVSAMTSAARQPKSMIPAVIGKIVASACVT